MADEVVKQFNLMERYEKSTVQDARKVLENATSIVVTKEKVIKVTVEEKDPKMAEFMGTKVSPQMAEIFGKKPFDPATGEGFGCGGCHKINK